MSATAQDEQYFRELIESRPGDGAGASPNQPLNAKLAVNSKTYYWDLDLDGVDESFFLGKKVQKDLLEIRDKNGIVLFSQLFSPQGLGSAFKTIMVKTLEPESPLILIAYDEGYVQKLEFEGQVRLYFLTVQKGDWKRAGLFKGPLLFHEKSYLREGHWKRTYRMGVKDFNNDGYNEVFTLFRKNYQVYFYQKENGNWTKRPKF